MQFISGHNSLSASGERLAEMLMLTTWDWSSDFGVP
jgi:hypothetical protein